MNHSQVILTPINIEDITEDTAGEMLQSFQASPAVEWRQTEESKLQHMKIS
jgi:hypothetical protein